MRATRQSSASARGRHCDQHGFVLIEALVAILIFSVGVLGLVGLQAAMTKAQTASKFRADAANLANELIGTMWSDLPNIARYVDANCASHLRCGAFKTKVGAVLPGGTLNVTNAAGLVEIRIRWSPPNEGTHVYATSTAMRS